eukprot:TRINITY_DN1417_c0_g1_i10.p1 TRINITY_DN1417_c0_g1~~TRINITY_DN1417_c0_g1_i10.p1  ORF type:complete len:374 (-),score=61.31 TRINITY_DN1417_c0_g1_i10:71-1192(-)
MDCEEDMYPYCTSCVACFPLLSNLHKQFVVFPNRGSASSMLRCRVNLGTPYNGKTVDKHITVNTREVLSETVYLPYNTSYQLCSNALGNWNGVISTMTFSGGLPTNQIEYSASNLPVIVLGNDIEVSCQNLDSMGFPIGDQIYKYNITLTAIASLSNERETLTESACKDEMPENLNFNCSYQIFGPNQLKEMVVWKLNGADCSLEECAVTGEYSETSVIQLQDLSPYDQSHLVRCSVTIGNLTYYREWSINFEECPTAGVTPTLTIVEVTSTSTPTPTPTQPNMTVTPTTKVTEPIEPELIAGIIAGVILCVILVVVLLVLLVVAIVLYIYCWLPDSRHSYDTTPSSGRRKFFNHNPQKVRYTKPDDPPIITV